jgi:hypothetical protein
VKAYADIADLPEDERVSVIAAAAAQGQIVGFVVDDWPDKAERYIRKLAAYPVRIIDQRPGPVKNTVLVRIGPKES